MRLLRKTRGEVITCPRHNRHSKNYTPKPRRDAVKNTLQGKTKGANSKNKISGRANKNNAFSATTRCKTKLLFVRTCDKLQSTVLCTSRLWLCAKKRFFSLLPIAKQSCFCNKPATSCNKLQNAVFCTSPLVTVCKETFFPLLPIAKQSCFLQEPATSCDRFKPLYFVLHRFWLWQTFLRPLCASG